MKETSKKSWKFLDKNIQSNKLIDVHLHRERHTQYLYDMNKQVLKSNYQSYGDYIRITYLGFREVKDENNLFKSEKTALIKQYAFVQNKYPYALRKGIRHYLIWSVSPLSSSKIQSIIEENKDNEYFKKYIWFVNDIINMSVPDIWHCHVFAK